MDKTYPCTYFVETGAVNTGKTLEIVKQYAARCQVEHILIASTSGKSGVAACEVLTPAKLVVVSHSSGFALPNTQEFTTENHQKIIAYGARVVTAAHAFGGVGRAVRRKFATFQVDELIAHVLRTFSEGIKVACEITLMAADAGWIGSGEEVVAVAGTGSGLDSAAVIRSATSQDYFDLRVLEIICKPRLNLRK
ncbi:MAG: pyruvate kinase alpha/beta domain-containing protein [Anaerolineae bacterium]